MKPTKRVNVFFLILVALHIGASVVVTMLSTQAVKLGTFTSLMLTQLLILVPSFLFFLIFGYDVFEWIPFKKLRKGTIALTVLFAFLIMPVISFVNVFSQLFTSNEIVGNANEILSMPVVLTVFIVGLFGPFCEEFTFRGVIYGGLKKSGYLLAAAAVSGIWFGLMHLNLNQFSYALILGIVLSLLVEASGSIYASIIVHAVINTWNILLLMAAERFYSAMGINVFEEASRMITNDYKFMTMGLILVVSVVTTLLATGVFIAISNHEGRLDKVMAVFGKNVDKGITDRDMEETGEETGEETEKGSGHVVTLSGYMAMALCFFVIFFLNKVLAFFIK